MNIPPKPKNVILRYFWYMKYHVKPGDSWYWATMTFYYAQKAAKARKR